MGFGKPITLSPKDNSFEFSYGFVWGIDAHFILNLSLVAKVEILPLPGKEHIVCLQEVIG